MQPGPDPGSPLRMARGVLRTPPPVTDRWEPMTGVSGAEARQPGKSSRFSVNWVAGNADVEVLDATTGRRHCGGASRLCKHVLSTRWVRLYGKVSDGGRRARGPEEAAKSAPGDKGTKLVPGPSPPHTLTKLGPAQQLKAGGKGAHS
ncbi:Double-stranded RNA-specific editase B2 [Pteropus alecto]|uniref:Double-stranded RNA-specific editase B2 n=1 Tax=Pteropus alecto TaxID=9402 RepID=L5K4J9_PTEAL|nr:Double-stranded RNA-specific editase B2 [Pteropus alecto]